jgi:D-alanine-D-alanine ligase
VSGDRLSVAVVQGGPVTEAAVSRASATSVARALAAAGHSVVRHELDGFLAESLRTGAYDVVFPAVHGAVGEDGSLQGLLEVLALPYVGSGVLASALAMNKAYARRMFGLEGLPIARGLALPRGDAKAAASKARSEIGPRLVVKPASHGSAIGVARLDAGATDRDVADAIEAVWAIDDTAIVEHFARGCEVTCGVLELRGAPTALPPTEIFSPGDPFYTFEARYAPGRSQHECPARFVAPVVERVQSVAVAAHVALGCRDLSRVDFIVGDDEDDHAVILLEVNTLPGFTDTSLYPEAAAVAGRSMPELCDALVRNAYARGPTPRMDPKPLPT